MSKHTPTDHKILDSISNRWSPRSFVPEPIPDEDLTRVFEAARWAASAFNEQPWRFIVARRQDTARFAAAVGALNEFNAAWAKDASVIVFGVAKSTFTFNGAPNPHSWYDLGQAVANLFTQATALGISGHQMAGFSAETVRETYDVPTGYEAVVAIALGKEAPADQLESDALREREVAPRARNPIDAFVFEGTWGAGEPQR